MASKNWNLLGKWVFPVLTRQYLKKLDLSSHCLWIYFNFPDLTVHVSVSQIFRIWSLIHIKYFVNSSESTTPQLLLSWVWKAGEHKRKGSLQSIRVYVGSLSHFILGWDLTHVSLYFLEFGCWSTKEQCYPVARLAVVTSYPHYVDYNQYFKFEYIDWHIWPTQAHIQHDTTRLTLIFTSAFEIHVLAVSQYLL